MHQGYIGIGMHSRPSGIENTSQVKKTSYNRLQVVCQLDKLVNDDNRSRLYRYGRFYLTRKAIAIGRLNIQDFFEGNFVCMNCLHFTNTANV